MKRQMVKIFTFIIAMILFYCPDSIFGYWHTVHSKIASKATEIADENVNFSETLKQIGLYNGIGHKIEGIESYSVDDEIYSIKEWIEYGSRWEDFLIFWFYGYDPHKNIPNCHFYNPLTNKGFHKIVNNEDFYGQSLIERARLDSENEWSYPMAKDLFYAALSGDSTKHSKWSMVNKHMWGPPFYGKQNMNKEEREQFFAWAFQALGHTLHLLADASVPAHTRNDSHGLIDTEPYEIWTRKHVDDDNLNYLKVSRNFISAL